MITADEIGAWAAEHRAVEWSKALAGVLAEVEQGDPAVILSQAQRAVSAGLGPPPEWAPGAR